ncbi:MAG: hypothetical protein IKN79_08040 [Eubacterium sp.]|nr:hypothetical protein [Eubacterium sp.]
MNMGMMDALELKNRIPVMAQQHPRVVAFFKENWSELQEGAVLTLNVKSKEGKEMVTNMRLSANDVEVLHLIRKALS